MNGSFFSLNANHGQAISYERHMSTNYSLLWSLKKSDKQILNGLDNIDTDRVLISDWTPQFSMLEFPATKYGLEGGKFTGNQHSVYHGARRLYYYYLQNMKKLQKMFRFAGRAKTW